MRADLWRVARLHAVAALVVAAAACGGDERSIRIGLLTDCRGILIGYEDQMLAGAELPLLERGARLTNGKPSGGVSGARVAGREVELVRGCTERLEFTILVEEARRLVEQEAVDAVVGPFADADPLIVQELARKYPEVIFVPAGSAECIRSNVWHIRAMRSKPAGVMFIEISKVRPHKSSQRRSRHQRRTRPNHSHGGRVCSPTKPATSIKSTRCPRNDRSVSP
jgi:hypothetical protein